MVSTTPVGAIHIWAASARSPSKPRWLNEIGDRRKTVTSPLFILEPTEISRPLAGKRVDVCEYPDGRLEIRHGAHVLPYRVFDKIRQVNQAAIVENGHLDAALAMAKLMQDQMPPKKRNNSEPCRRQQPSHMFVVPERREEPSTKPWPGRPPLQMGIQIEAARRMLESLEGAHCTAAGPGASPHDQRASRDCAAQ